MEIIRALWEKWAHLPWRHFNSPFEQWKVLPTFLVGEYLFIGLALLSLLHACRQGRLHLVAWIAALLTGSANDVFFMALPLVDNFWQAQATLMITPRFPIYISCVYIVFMYSAITAVWRLRLTPVAEAAMAGLMAEMVYAPYDIVGIKFLWWTWHDTDPPIAARLLGVPVGSSLWVVTFTATFALGLRLLLLNQRWPAPLVLGISALVSTPLMMAQMSLLQLLSGDQQGKPTERSLVLGVTVYLLVVLVTVLRRPFNARRHPASGRIRPGPDALHKFALMVYYLLLSLLLAWGSPERHVSTGVHQSVGPCNVTEVDLTGLSREKYLCPAHFDEDWHFGCAPGGKAPAGGVVEWYTVCGRAHTNYPLWQTVVTGLGLVGGAMYFRSLTPSPTTSKMD